MKKNYREKNHSHASCFQLEICTSTKKKEPFARTNLTAEIRKE